ncbi:hypothetical protein L2E82_14723 [Cichorium intybus]|uniref:Uncharacterized protein n=1 Tax=Cichorium intybus TaxID=13427 RepID=A0ACB9F184_CICIN|nr:hypothetical protein L2E82_14723 [Cichorium intybus]
MPGNNKHERRRNETWCCCSLARTKKLVIQRLGKKQNLELETLTTTITTVYAAAHHYRYPIRNHLPLAPPVLCLLYYPKSPYIRHLLDFRRLSRLRPISYCPLKFLLRGLYSSLCVSVFFVERLFRALSKGLFFD